MCIYIYIMYIYNIHIYNIYIYLYVAMNPGAAS